MEDLTVKFIWRTFKDQTNKKSTRVKLNRAKIKPEKGGLGIMDIKQFWMAAKIGWLRKLRTKDYNEVRKTNNIHQQPDENINQTSTDTEDWLKMLMCELIKISGDLSLTPTKILTSWGTEKMRTLGLRLKNKFWKAVFTGIEDLEEGFYYVNPQYLGETVIWSTQDIRTDGRQLRAGGINSIAYGITRDETGITTINHLITPVEKPIDYGTRESNRIKTKAELQIQTGKAINDNEYQEIIRAVEELSPNMHGIISSVFLATPPPYVSPKISGLSPKILYLYCDKRRDIR